MKYTTNELKHQQFLLVKKKIEEGLTRDEIKVYNRNQKTLAKRWEREKQGENKD